jgi:hypothetical protein
MRKASRTLTTLAVAVATGVLGTPAGAQIVRSNSLSHTQDPIANTATANCSIAADGISSTLSYTGYVQIFFTGPNDNSTRLVNVNFAVGPTARKFVAESAGVYRVEARLTGSRVSVSAETTRGPLGFQISNQFACNAAIAYAGVTTDYVHAFSGSDNFYGYGSTP